MVLFSELTPSEVIIDENAVYYTNQLKARIDEISGQLLKLDDDFEAGKIAGDENTKQRMKLKQTLSRLREEMLRMDMAT